MGQARTMPPTAAAPARTRRAPGRWHLAVAWSPLRIVLVYAVAGILWITFSDRLVDTLIRDVQVREWAQTVKGALFIAVTSGLLWMLIRHGQGGLREVGAELRATIESIADGVLVVDASSRIVAANRAAAELVGLSSPSELVGDMDEWAHRFELRYTDGTPIPPERYAIRRALLGERVRSYEGVLRRADGTDVFVSVSAAPVVDPRARARDGRLAVAVFRDVSRARRLDEIREEFLATAAHEFKTPLAVIKAYAQLMQKREPAEQQALVVIQRQVERLTRLVQDLLDTSRLRLEESGRRERFDLGQLVREVVERFRPAAPSHTLATHARPRTEVSADRERIARVVSSLVDNAVKFSPTGGPVEARVEVEGGEAVCSVSDRGLGIPSSRQARIFERFYRAHAGTPDDYGGLGLGLDMSREIVTRHGGRMWFESEPGRGSTFHFSLPLAPEGP